VSVRGNLIVLTLDKGVLGEESLFDLVRHTLRFTPVGTRFRAENIPWQWDPEFGSEVTGAQATLRNFSFPFSGRNWNVFSVGVTGSMTFGEAAGGRGGISVDRFAELQQATAARSSTLSPRSVSSSSRGCPENGA
jgi:hypothetical protein